MSLCVRFGGNAFFLRASGFKSERRYSLSLYVWDLQRPQGGKEAVTRDYKPQVLLRDFHHYSVINSSIKQVVSCYLLRP